MIGQSFHIIVEPTDIEWVQWPIKKCCGTVLATESYLSYGQNNQFLKHKVVGFPACKILNSNC